VKDIVFPKNNEQEFIKLAETLGYDELVFVHSDEKKFYNKKGKLKITNALLCDPKKVQSCRKKADLILVQSSTDDRFVIEKSKADLVFGFEAIAAKDKTHQRVSGLNHILCRFAAQTNKKLGFDFNMLLNARNKAILIGRMKQNIKLCRKYKVKTVIASFAKTPLEMRSPNDLQSFFVKLGMHPAEAKKSLKW